MSQLVISAFIILSSFTKSDFYTLLKEGSSHQLKEMEQKISEQKSDNTQQAYLGVVTMKLAEHQKTPMEKLKFFKAGKAKLEKSIQSDNSNVEFRFLRLIIQENAPKSLKYSDQINQDAKLITEKFDTLSSELQSIIKTYSKTSQNLKI